MASFAATTSIIHGTFNGPSVVLNSKSALLRAISCTFTHSHAIADGSIILYVAKHLARPVISRNNWLCLWVMCSYLVVCIISKGYAPHAVEFLHPEILLLRGVSGVVASCFYGIRFSNKSSRGSQLFCNLEKLRNLSVS